MVENLTLFDKMHEGLIVLSQKDRTLQFASKPAIWLIKQVMSKTDISAIEDMPERLSGYQLTEADFEKRMFEETKISMNNYADD